MDKSQSVQNGDHTTRSRIVGSSSIPMAQKRLVEVWRGWAGGGGSYCQLHVRFPEDRPCSHPDRAQLAHSPCNRAATFPIGLERTDWLQPAAGGRGGKCSKGLKCRATHIHTSKSLNPHPFWSQTFPRQDSILTTLQEIEGGDKIWRAHHLLWSRPNKLTTPGISDWPATSTTTAIASTEARVTSTQICPVYV